jgi:hypothetical protein
MNSIGTSQRGFLSPSRLARRRRQQIKRPATDAERLLGREDDGAPFVRHRDRAERFLVHGELKRRREIVERHEFLIADHRDPELTLAVARQQRERRSWRRLA